MSVRKLGTIVFVVVTVAVSVGLVHELISLFWHAPTGVSCISSGNASSVAIQPGDTCQDTSGTTHTYAQLLSDSRMKYFGLSWLVEVFVGAIPALIVVLSVNDRLKARRARQARVLAAARAAQAAQKPLG